MQLQLETPVSWGNRGGWVPGLSPLRAAMASLNGRKDGKPGFDFFAEVGYNRARYYLDKTPALLLRPSSRPSARR